MPFKLSKITIISTAEGIEDSQNDNNVKWKLNILQNNDLYFTISKNENYDKEDISWDMIMRKQEKVMNKFL